MSKASRRARKVADRQDSRRHAAKPRAVEEAAPLGTSNSDEAPSSNTRYGYAIAVVAVMVLAALVRLRVAGVPLERDEGEYAYAGQLILNGIPPYQLAYNMKFPGTYYAFALIESVFGQTSWGIHVGLLVVNAATTVVLYFLARRVMGTFAACIAAIAFAILSLDRWTMGVFAHATHFVILPALAGFLVLLRAIESRRLPQFVAGGVLLGIAVLMKQQGIFFMPVAIALILWSRRQRPFDFKRTALETGAFLVGALIPFAILCAVLLAQGVFGKFWFWTFQYAQEYVSEIAPADAWGSFVYGVRNITRATRPLWILAGSGFALLWMVRWKSDTRVFLTAFLIGSLLALTPGFYFREHYFILLLPAAAMFIGAACVSIARIAERVVPLTAARAIAVAIFIVFAGSYAVKEQEYLVSVPTRDLSRQSYGVNPFIEAVDIAQYIREHTKESDRIAVLGSEPEIYFYANRKSATGYIYTYGLMEQQPYAKRMQEEMIREVETAHPAYVVFVSIGTSWLARRSDERILVWADQYIRKCYDLAGIADIYSFERSEMLWDAPASSYSWRSANGVYTYRRKSDLPCTT